jgi:hypothetical protein
MKKVCAVKQTCFGDGRFSYPLNIFDQAILVSLSPMPQALCLIAERSAISATLMSEVS